MRQIRILHVDDEPDFLESSKEFLECENSNFSIDTATSTEEGLKLLKGGGYDVVLSDYQLPDMNGLEFLQHLRESGYSIPFILFTGKGREEVVIEALNKGADYYIQKGRDVKSLYGTLAHVIQETVDKRSAKNALQESEVRYRLISENTSDLIATTTFDLDLIYTYISPSHKKVLGYEPEDLIGKSGFDFIHPEDKKIWLPVLGNYVRAKVKEFITRKSSEVIASIEYRVRDKSDMWHLLESTVNIINDELLFISRDITERRQKEQELDESKKKYKTLVENVPVGIYYSDVKGTFFYGNKKAEEIIGYKREELVGENYFKLNLLDRKGMSKALKLLALNALGKATGPDEFVLNRKDGSKSVVDIYTQTASIEGQKIVLGMALDVTKQRQAENVVKAVEREYKTIFETTGTAMLIIEEDMTVSLINTEFEKLTGYSKEEVEGKKSWIEFIVKDDLAKMKEYHYLRRTNPDAAPRNYEFRGVLKSGDVRDVLITIGIIPETEKSVAALLDIAERKRAGEERERFLRELEAKNTEMERFTYTVSHDLKSPLFAIQGFTALAREDLEQGTLEKLARDLERVEKAAATMDRLLNDTLQLSRIGRMVNPAEEVSFGTIVAGALELVATQIETSGVEITTTGDFPTVYVDRVRIEEMLVNLIVDSIKYSGAQSSPKIAIGCRVEDGETVFFVDDNGRGIDPSRHKQVFELFYKVDKSSQGTGAGLAIVKRIVEVHGGRIWIESEQEKGCTICFTLPTQ